jgi:hypothetical protein
MIRVQEGTRSQVVPYPSAFVGEVQNFGFIELKGEPRLVDQIAESKSSPSLRSALIDINDESTAFTTIGCGRWTQEKSSSDLPDIKISVFGYLAICLVPLSENLDKGRWLELANAFCTRMNSELGGRAHTKKKTLYIDGRLSVDGLTCPNLIGWHLCFDVAALGVDELEAAATWDDAIDAFRIAVLEAATT